MPGQCARHCFIFGDKGMIEGEKATLNCKMRIKTGISRIKAWENVIFLAKSVSYENAHALFL